MRGGYPHSKEVEVSHILLLNNIMLKKILPLADRVLIKRIQPVTKTAGGILLPESQISKNNEGEVVAVGPGQRTREGELLPVSVTVGDKVLLPEYGGLPIKVDGEEVYLFRNDEILAKITNLRIVYMRNIMSLSLLPNEKEFVGVDLIVYSQIKSFKIFQNINKSLVMPEHKTRPPWQILLSKKGISIS
eukprot:scaffold4338_cov183-Ochromonas_danica.AAC.2